MKYSRYCFWILVLVAVAVSIAACKQRVRGESSPLESERDEEPLLLDEEPLLLEEEPLLLEEEPLLLEEPPVEGDNAELLADNSRCHVCHINYEDEELAVTHARAGVGCERCHGACDAHCSDEDNITPPDIMYPPDKVNSFCKSCHPEGKLGGGKKYCTDCHGQHRLGYRTRKWDKETGELIEDDKVRMLTD